MDQNDNDRKEFEREANEEDIEGHLTFQDQMGDIVDEPPIDEELLNEQAEREVEIPYDANREFPPLPDDEDYEDELVDATRQMWKREDGLEEGETLQHDETAYLMYHGVNAEWPCLSFDFVRDDFGERRSRVCISYLLKCFVYIFIICFFV